MNILNNNLKQIIQDIFLYRETKKYDFSLPQSDNSSENNDKATNYPKNIFSDINENLKHMKIIYNSLINSDIVIRDFSLKAKNKIYKSFIIYIDGMVDAKNINDFILSPLMLKNQANS